MSWNFPFLKPAAHIARLPDEQVNRLYPKLRWQILESTFIGYAVFYLVRNNLPVVSKEMGQALGYSKGQIGDLLALTAISYGIGKFAMGTWSDQSNPRYFMPLDAERLSTRDGMGPLRTLPGALVQYPRERNNFCILEHCP
jgi:OPA family glycerol-3-phosphate transporter-like MFS transporter